MYGMLRGKGDTAMGKSIKLEPFVFRPPALCACGHFIMRHIEGRGNCLKCEAPKHCFRYRDPAVLRAKQRLAKKRYKDRMRRGMGVRNVSVFY